MSGALNGAPFDSGMRQWLQPNGVTFTARLWGDEYLSWMETSGGYRITQGSGGWYYYARLDAAGEFAPTSARVGLERAPSGSYKLERSSVRIAAINQRIAQAGVERQRARDWFAEAQAAAGEAR